MNIIGCDFHPRYQVVAWIDEETGEIRTRRLEHGKGEVRAFYAGFPPGARIGIEATFPALWFERLLGECGHELWVGDAAHIRALEVREQKTDARDAKHILELLRTNRFPRIWVPSQAFARRPVDRWRGRTKPTLTAWAGLPPVRCSPTRRERTWSTPLTTHSAASPAFPIPTAAAAARATASPNTFTTRWGGLVL